MPRQPTVGGGRQSTADELRKWASLRDDGLISQEEFAQMREKLLGPGANA
ncbi:SHOCT domain-containing protein [Brevundimonas diminuta]